MTIIILLRATIWPHLVFVARMATLTRALRVPRTRRWRFKKRPIGLKSCKNWLVIRSLMIDNGGGKCEVHQRYQKLKIPKPMHISIKMNKFLDGNSLSYPFSIKFNLL